MAKYRKRPVVIDAVKFQYNQESLDKIELELGLDPIRVNFEQNKPQLIISTLEGEMRCDVGDYIIRGVKGEFYPCKADILELTYEKLED